ncbi:MAG: sigma-70 family RNA polymerase sigma factor [Acidimicrobiia bacterium]|nr:sigma-70 family RNA polymerase sigma factor [Acidimicrobiia bacterium]
MSTYIPAPAPADLDGLYRSEYRRVLALAYSLTGSRTAAEELTQEGFLAAHRSWDRISRYDDPAAWVRRVVANRAVSTVRRRVAEAKAVTAVGRQPQAHDELAPEASEFWEQVRRLPGRQAQTIALHYLEDRPVAEIAQILDVSAETVKVHLHRGRKALAVALACDEPEEETR